MIFLSVGLPSRFAEWCDRVACSLVGATVGPFDLVSANTCDEIALASMKSRVPHLVIGARKPTDELRAALSESRRRFVAILDEPRAALYNVVTRHELEWKPAIRAVAGSCASMLGYAEMPGALVLRADQEGRDPVTTAAAIAQWFDIEISRADLAALLQDHADPSAIPAPVGFDAWWAGVSANDRAVVDGALTGYTEYFSNGRMGPLVWQRDLFFIGDNPEEAADRAFDISGPIRYLLFGPYMDLPPGTWGATIVLAVSRGAANLGYSVEILAGSSFACIARGMIHPNGEGLCETSIEFTISEATNQALEFRIANLQPALDGRLALVHVALSPRIKARAQLPFELTQALGL